VTDEGHLQAHIVRDHWQGWREGTRAAQAPGTQEAPGSRLGGAGYQLDSEGRDISLGPPSVRRPAATGRSTGVKDALYTIALKNADRYEALARRAAMSSDEELAEFFRRMRDESRENAERAKRLLSQRVAD
jgi:hypothetical protein